MATFLTATETSAAIELVIREADKELVLISAYVYPRLIYLDRLRDAAERGVNITLVFGKKKMDARVKEQFKKLDNLRIYFLPELHAKCYCNEKHAVVTSLNLLNSSEAHNREMGVRLESGTDAVAYAACMAEVRSILKASEMVYDSPKVEERSETTAMAPLPKSGHCIRCGSEQPCNPDAPLCIEDFKVWVKHEDPLFPEQYCHTCGKRSKVSMARPLCADCRHHYKAAIAQLDAKRTGGLLTWRTWRV